MGLAIKTNPFTQPDSFAFSKENQEKVKKIIAKYPEGRQRSAVMPLLDLAQRQHDNWIPTAAMDHIAELLSIPPIKVYEVATFYTMYNLKPVGKYLLQVCRTTPCWLRGSDNITAACKKVLGIGLGESTEDGMFTLVEVECLGACANAPMVQINDHYYEDLTEASMQKLIEDLRAGKSVKQGSQAGRKRSEPAQGLTTLTEVGTC
jgi:NADH dehydrogenase (ubiquinone) flavoprotein 2